MLHFFPDRTNITSFLLIITFIAGMILGSRAISPPAARGQVELLIVGGLGLVTLGCVVPAFFVYKIIVNHVRGKHWGYTIAFTCPEGLEITKRLRNNLPPNYFEGIFPGITYEFRLTDREQWSYTLRLNSRENPLRPDTVYEICLTDEFLHLVREEGKKQIEVDDNNGEELFALTFTMPSEPEYWYGDPPEKESK